MLRSYSWPAATMPLSTDIWGPFSMTSTTNPPSASPDAVSGDQTTTTTGDELVVKDVTAWRSWLSEHHTKQEGTWLVLAKKGTVEPTSLTYDQALEEAICWGWIDGKLQRRDDATYMQRFTPRRPRSLWSKRNVGMVERLRREGRLQPSGIREIERAQADGRWETAYGGSRDMEVPPDLAEALAANPDALAMFEILTRANRYAVLWNIHNAKRAETRQRKIEKYVAMLARGETPHPQSSARTKTD